MGLAHSSVRVKHQTDFGVVSKCCRCVFFLCGGGCCIICMIPFCWVALLLLRACYQKAKKKKKRWQPHSCISVHTLEQKLIMRPSGILLEEDERVFRNLTHISSSCSLIWFWEGKLWRLLCFSHPLPAVALLWILEMTADLVYLHKLDASFMNLVNTSLGIPV